MPAPIFGILAALLVCSALGVVLADSPVRSALSLIATLFLLAVTYLFLNATMVAALQVLVYAGAIVVLFLFVIMLLNLQEDRPAMARMGLRMLAGFAGSLFVLLALAQVVPRDSAAGGIAATVPASFGTPDALAQQLFTKSLLAFEVTGVLLLVAVIGAVVLAKRKLV